MLDNSSFFDTKRRKQGLAAGTVVYTGEQKLEQLSLSRYRYNQHLSEERSLSLSELSKPPKGSCDWINIVGLHDSEAIERIGALFGLHPLTLEDVVNIHQRPKLELFESYLYVVLRMIRIGDEGEVHNEQLSLILGENFVLSFQEMPGDVFEPLRKRLTSATSRIRTAQVDFLFYTLMDIVVDNYFMVLEYYDSKLERLEEEIIDTHSRDIVVHLSYIRRDLLLLRKVILPVREILNALMRDPPGLLSEGVQIYLRDVYDHSIQANDLLESLRDLQASLHDLYLSQLGHRSNEVMKVLTIIATIFMPLSFLAGVYGMNFDHMPELHWFFAYPVLLLVMCLVAGAMLFYFWRKDWF